MKNKIMLLIFAAVVSMNNVQASLPADVQNAQKLATTKMVLEQAMQHLNLTENEKELMDAKFKATQGLALQRLLDEKIKPYVSNEEYQAFIFKIYQAYLQEHNTKGHLENLRYDRNFHQVTMQFAKSLEGTCDKRMDALSADVMAQFFISCKECSEDETTSREFCAKQMGYFMLASADTVLDSVGLDVLNTINPETREVPAL